MVVPWHAKLGAQIVDHSVVPPTCPNDEVFELQDVLAGKVPGHPARVTAAPFVHDEFSRRDA